MFDQMFAGAAALLLEAQFGVAGTYTAPPAGSSPMSVTVIVSETPSTVDIDEALELDSYDAVLKVRQSVLATPAKGGRFAVNGTNWDVVAVPQLRNGVWRCSCKRAETFEIGHGREQRG